MAARALRSIDDAHGARGSFVGAARGSAARAVSRRSGRARWHAAC
jgi:hypothetical protein